MTLTSYTTLVQNAVDDFSARAQAVIEQQIKEKYQEILRYTAKWLIGTTEEDVVASTSYRYITPTAFMQISSVLWKDAGDDNFSILDPIDEHDYLEVVNSDAGTPTGWYVNGSQIFFDKTPDTAGTARVFYIPVQDELAGATTSVIPDRFTDVLITGALAGFKAYEGLPDAREYESQYKGSFGRQGRIEGLLGSMIAELSTHSKNKKVRFWNA